MREILISSVISTLGFENEWTIWFCQICEDPKVTNEMVRLAYKEAITKGMIIEEE